MCLLSLNEEAEAWWAPLCHEGAILLEVNRLYGTLVCVCRRRRRVCTAWLCVLVCCLFMYLMHHLFDFAPSMRGGVEVSAP